MQAGAPVQPLAHLVQVVALVEQVALRRAGRMHGLVWWMGSLHLPDWISRRQTGSATPAAMLDSKPGQPSQDRLSAHHLLEHAVHVAVLFFTMVVPTFTLVVVARQYWPAVQAG